MESGKEKVVLSFYACVIESSSTGSPRASGKKALSRKILCYPVLGVAIIAYLAISFLSFFLLFVMDTSKVSDTYCNYACA